MDAGIMKDVELAELLGWTDVKVGGCNEKEQFTYPETWVHGYRPGSPKHERELTPMWSRNGDACLDLIVEHEITLKYGDGFVFAHAHFKHSVYAYYGSHPSKMAAIKWAVVEVVVKKFKETTE
jgi:hypothetical protein